ncbi:Hsp20/alpha crystallin family protein [Flavobacterium alvei]|nr:Hsp20/alpha crystallin family protein [Flavobacterium alvei]HQE34148.1 Hsp20/alpha crystallin family protein [Flavobacterium alvei]HQF47720.1 Hsp20/alpha crystallin family protein [Flavobacterium alvei]
MKTLVKKDGMFPSLESKSIHNFFDDFITKDLFDWTDRNFAAIGSNLPSVNLKETDTEIEVELAAPGMKREDFKVEVDNDMLMISSEKEEKKEEVSKKENFIRREFNYQSFSRTFSLPETIDENKIEANYKDGILHVVVGKKEGAKKRTLKSIPIQ